MNPELVTLQARVLGAQDIIAGRNRIEKPDHLTEWNNVYRSELLSAVNLEKWAFVYPNNFYNEVSAFYNLMEQVARPLGIRMNPCKWVEIPDTRVNTYMQNIRELAKMKPNFIVVATPTEKGEHYAAIKKFLCCECPIPSHIITHSKVRFDPFFLFFSMKALDV